MSRSNRYTRLVVLFCILVAQSSWAEVLLTVAGGYTGDGGPASEAIVVAPQDLAMDQEGNIYFAEGKRIRRIDSAGIITTVVQAEQPIRSIYMDEAGAIYFSAGFQVFKRDSWGEVSTVAGSQNYRQDNENVPALEAYFGSTNLSIAVDGDGNIYIAPDVERVWKVDAASGNVATVAGSSGSGDSGDGGPATEAQFMNITDIAVDGDGNLYITDRAARRVRMVAAASGIITTVAGDGTPFAAEGKATEVGVNEPTVLFVTDAGELYIGSLGQVRKVDSAGNLTVVAGRESWGGAFSGDNGPASEAEFNQFRAVWVDANGEMYIADTGNNRVRKIDSSGIVRTIAGGVSGEGRLATRASLNGPMDMAVDAAGNVYIADTENHTVKKVDASTGILTTVAGGGTADGPEYGDGGPAIEARLQSPRGVCVDRDGNLIIVDAGNFRIRKVDASGTITRIAGSTDYNAPLGDGGPATEAKLGWLLDAFVADDGTIYIADGEKHRVRKVDSSGIITTIAGNGSPTASGDGGPAIDAGLPSPRGIFVSDNGDIFVISEDRKVRKIDGTSGRINTYGSPLFSEGDITDWDGFCSKLTRDANLDTPNPGKRIWSLLSAETQTLIGNWSADSDLSGENKSQIIDALNDVLGREDFYQSLDFSDTNLPRETQDFLQELLQFMEHNSPHIVEVQKLNRFLIKAAYPEELTKSPTKLVDFLNGATRIHGDSVGNLYISQQDWADSPKVVRVNPLGEVETVIGGLDNPQGVFYDEANAALYVAEAGKGRIGKVVSAPRIVVDRNEVRLGLLSQTGAMAMQINVSNEGDNPLVAAFSLEGDDAFELATTDLVLDPGTTEGVEVTFAPPAAGDYAATLRISSNDLENGEMTIPITGKRADVPRMGLSRQDVVFDSLLVQREVSAGLVIRNEGSLPLEAMLTLDGDDVFALSSAEVVVDPGDSVAVEISFAPVAEGNYSATLRIASNDPENGELTVSITGTGVAGKAIGDEWTSLRSGEVGHMAIDRGGRIFLNHGYEMFRSSDGGENWERLRHIMNSGAIMLADPEDRQRIYTGIGNTVDWSEDGGQTWEVEEADYFENPTFPSGVQKLASTFVDGSVTLYAKVHASGRYGTGFFLYRSTDRGETWEQVMTLGPPPQEALVDTAKIWAMASINDIAVDALNPETLYVGSEEGLFSTQDGGESWTQLDGLSADRIAVGGGGIYCWRRAAQASRKLFRSDDQGKSWKELNANWQIEMVVNPVNPDIVYTFPQPGVAAYLVVRSVDGGENWEQVLEIPSDKSYGDHVITSILFDPSDPSIVYVSTQEGLLTRKFDDPEYVPPDPDDIEEPGEELPPTEWQQIGPWKPLAVESVGQIMAFAPSNPDVMYVVGDQSGQLYRSQDGGITWAKVAGSSPKGNAYSLAVDKDDPDTIFIGTYAGIFKSENGGDSWEDINTDISMSGAARSIAIDPRDGNIIFAGLSAMFGGLGGVVRTVDGGVTWERVMDEERVEEVGIAAEVGRMYAKVQEKGIFYSDDGGDTWAQAEGWSGGWGEDLFVSADGEMVATNEDFDGSRFAISPANPSVVYKGRWAVLRSDDGGQTWEKVWDGLGEVRKVVAHPEDEDQLFVVVYGHGIFATRDGGNTWNSVGGKEALSRVVALTVDPQNSQRVYLAKDDGAFRSISGGEDWQRMTPSSMGWMEALLVDPEQSSRIYAVGQNINVSEDRGDSWETMTPWPAFLSRRALTVTDSPSGPVFLAIDESESQSHRLYRSLDGGLNWQVVQDFPQRVVLFDIKADPLQPEMVYGAGSGSESGEGGIFVSGDHGETWEQIDNVDASSLAVRGKRIYAIRGGRLYRSDDRGLGWTETHPEEVSRGGASLVQISPANPDIVYCYGSSPHDGSWLIVRSTDGGTTWEEFPMTTWVYGIAVGPGEPSMVYARGYEGVLKAEFDDPEYQEPDDLVDTGEDDEVLKDPRRAAFWKLYRSVNLGPRAGNGVHGVSMVIARNRGRAYIGNWGTHNVSIVDLELNAVTGIIENSPFTHVTEIDSTRLPGEQLYMHLAFSESLDELYVVDNASVLVFDPRTHSLVRQIPIGGSFEPWYSSTGEGGKRPLLVDESAHRLYIGNKSSVTVLDLLAGKAIEQIPLTSPPADVENPKGISGLALDKEAGKLYASNNANKMIEIIDLENFQVDSSISLDYRPVDIVVDPARPFLYAATEYGLLLRVDLRTGVHDPSVDIPRISGRLLLDAENDRLWVAKTTGYGADVGLAIIRLGDFRLEESDVLPQRDVRATQVLSLQKELESDQILVMTAGNLLMRLDSRSQAIKSVIEIGADPNGIAVSEAYNQVYAARGEIGGFFVLDFSGNIIRTVEGVENLSRDVFVDDESQRLFLIGSQTLATYELPSFKLLHTEMLRMPDYVFNGQLAADHRRGVLWVAVEGTSGGLYKLDLLTGVKVGSVLAGKSQFLVALGSDGDKAYLASSTNRSRRVEIFDLESEEITGVIDLSMESSIRYVEVDEERNRLYIFATKSGLLEITVADATRDEVIETVEARASFNGGVAVDKGSGKAYLDTGHILDLETLDLGSSFTGNFDAFLDFIAVNRLTNTLYAIEKEEGMSVYLGPAGTEVPPPPPPAGVQAEEGDEKVRLSWQAVQDTTLVGYNIYRRDREDSGFTRITPAPLTDTLLVDEELTNGQTYTYQLTSVGKGRLESILRSDTVPATPTGGGNFRLLVLRQSLSVQPGDVLSMPLSVEVLEDFAQTVTLSAVAPEGLEVTFHPAEFQPPRILGVRVQASADVLPGRYEVLLQGQGGERINTVEIVVEVTEKGLEQSVLTAELDQEEVPLDIPLSVTGRLFPGTQTQVQVDFRAERADTLITRTVDTDQEGGYRVQFLAPFTDKWNVTASWAGNDDFEGTQSRTVAFVATSGKTRITATSDLADDADLGWIATLKGRIYPSPGTVAVTIKVRKPDKTEETIEGVLSSAEGFYGHDLRMDQKGLWEIWTSWQGNGRFLGATSSVVAVPVAADVGRVILLACGQDSNRDIFWPTSNYLANLAYRTFQKRRLLKEKVFYLNDRQDQDVDRDGFMEDVDGTATMSDMSAAWTWAKDRVNVDNPLFLYLVGKGTPMGLEVSPGEVLTARQLGQELVALEETTGSSATLIVDAAHAGNFIRDLSQQGRQVIASTGPGLAFYQAEGYMSFSQYFFTDLYQGKSLQEAFLHTHNILRNLPGGFRDQRPGLEAEGNVIANQPGDYLRTMDAFIGAPFELGDLSPQIKASSLSSVAGGAGKRIVTQTAPISEDGLGPRLKLAKLVAEQGVEISARIDDAEENLKVVRAMIIPPASDSLSSLTGYPEVKLTDEDGDGVWVGVSHEFLKEGVYPVILYAIDGAGNAAEPLRTTVLVEASGEPAVTGDFNGDGLVDFADFFMFADAFGGDDPAYDLDGSGLVDFGDFFLFADAFGGPLGKLLELAEEMLHLPTVYELGVPYPNPFNSEVVVKYSLPGEGDVELLVYNALGQVVRRLVEGHRRLGHHRVIWDGRDEDGRQLATGMYVVRMRAGDFHQVRKIAFVK